ncbi:Ribokinase-like protein [Exidia glandulosa HHB12029]|uniref:pyridoxal kinase n=1 Tax=Exidia glandulosa HHB12029 TaxID=1314781 RepID=A0A165F269_EXIGL|nr:Ribokinase-like protein [Exidia glandulosa HHB12029]
MTPPLQGPRPVTPDPRRVLSIQSHVVSGYVGGKAAVFPMQLLGWDVDVVNTVNFSNHSGYGRFGGPRTDASDLATIFSYLEQNGLLQPSRVLTGYIPNAKSLEVIADVIRKLKTRHPEIIYLLDPVMGDAGKLYVSPDVVPLYRALLSCATVITPNYFEVEVLTGVALTSADNLREALDKLHTGFGVPHVVVSSIPLSAALRASVPFPPGTFSADDDLLLCVCSSRRGEGKEGASSDVYAFGIAQIPGYFSGVGDLFSALVLAHFDGDGSLGKATGLAVGTVHRILRDTAAHSAEGATESTDSELDAADVERRVRRMRRRELRVIQNAGVIASCTEAVEGVLWAGFWT